MFEELKPSQPELWPSLPLPKGAELQASHGAVEHIKAGSGSNMRVHWGFVCACSAAHHWALSFNANPFLLLQAPPIAATVQSELRAAVRFSATILRPSDVGIHTVDHNRRLIGTQNFMPGAAFTSKEQTQNAPSPLFPTTFIGDCPPSQSNLANQVMVLKAE
ncbi:hypothetical protein NQZ68_005832 [Dissostichus eleginoides]|nr:hypothetical protein NQZ68_005832 [Dissostichus eleginoides]